MQLPGGTGAHVRLYRVCALPPGADCAVVPRWRHELAAQSNWELVKGAQLGLDWKVMGSVA